MVVEACAQEIALAGLPRPRTCWKCGLGPCALRPLDARFPAEPKRVPEETAGTFPIETKPVPAEIRGDPFQPGAVIVQRAEGATWELPGAPVDWDALEGAGLAPEKGLLLEPVQNGFIVWCRRSGSEGIEVAPVAVAETPDGLGPQVQSWARWQKGKDRPKPPAAEVPSATDAQPAGAYGAPEGGWRVGDRVRVVGHRAQNMHLMPIGTECVVAEGGGKPVVRSPDGAAVWNIGNATDLHVFDLVERANTAQPGGFQVGDRVRVVGYRPGWANAPHAMPIGSVHTVDDNGWGVPAEGGGHWRVDGDGLHIFALVERKGGDQPPTDAPTRTPPRNPAESWTGPKS